MQGLDIQVHQSQILMLYLLFIISTNLLLAAVAAAEEQVLLLIRLPQITHLMETYGTMKIVLRFMFIQIQLADGFKQMAAAVEAELVRVHIEFDGTASNMTDELSASNSFNVSSITDNGAGDYTITFTSPVNNPIISCKWCRRKRRG